MVSIVGFKESWFNSRHKCVYL